MNMTKEDKRYQLTVTLEELQYIFDGLVLQYGTFLREHMVFSTKRTGARLKKFENAALPMVERIFDIEGIRH